MVTAMITDTPPELQEIPAKTSGAAPRPARKKDEVTKMKALVYRGPGKKNLEDVPKPAVKEPTDAVLRITKTTICGTDLHILKGDLPTVVAGRILGHEGIGVIDEVGSGVSRFKKGERVLISGAAGGVGTAAVQLAHAAGAQVVASVRDVENHPNVISLGADQVVEPDRAPDHGPYDVSLELVGAPGVTAVLPALAVGGRVVVIGVGAGSKVELNLLAMMGRRATISASTLRVRSREEKAAVAAAVGERALALLERGSIGVPVAEKTPMDRATEAYERFASGGKFGKIVLVN